MTKTLRSLKKDEKEKPLDQDARDATRIWTWAVSMDGSKSATKDVKGNERLLVFMMWSSLVLVD